MVCVVCSWVFRGVCCALVGLLCFALCARRSFVLCARGSFVLCARGSVVPFWLIVFHCLLDRSSLTLASRPLVPSPCAMGRKNIVLYTDLNIVCSSMYSCLCNQVGRTNLAGDLRTGSRSQSRWCVYSGHGITKATFDFSMSTPPLRDSINDAIVLMTSK